MPVMTLQLYEGNRISFAMDHGTEEIRVPCDFSVTLAFDDRGITELTGERGDKVARLGEAIVALATESRPVDSIPLPKGVRVR